MSQTQNSPFIPLHRILSEQRPSSYPVAIYKHEMKSWRDFTAWTGGLCLQLSQSQIGTWALICDDGFAFLTGFLALIYSGKKVVLPPNANPGTLDSLSAAFGGIISDNPPPNVACSVLVPGQQSSEIAFQPITAEVASIDLFTSGTTGTPKKIAKSLRQLEAEVEVLEQTFGEMSIFQAPFFATVSHQHIYGLLFKLLWPLSAGYPFYSPILQFPEFLMDATQSFKTFRLISCPAHLQRFPQMTDFTLLRSRVHQIFSSGGPLSPPSAKLVYEHTGVAPIEVLGSSETGGVGWYCCADKSVPKQWQSLHHVEIAVRENEGVFVRSPFSSPDGVSWIPLGDKGTLLDNGRFTLKGRIDRIIKIEEKRVSLTQIEDILERHTYIQKIVVLPLVRNRLWSRTVLGAVVQLSDEGKEALTQKGNRLITANFKKLLGEYIEPVAIPKLWRYPPVIPSDAQGKNTLQVLAPLFECNESKNTRPKILKSHLSHNRLELQCEVPPNLPYFEGHFEDMQVLPGVVIIDWMIYLAKKERFATGTFTGLERIKFTHIIQPGSLLSVTQIWNPAKEKLSFEITAGTQPCAKGTICLSSSKRSLNDGGDV